MDLKILPGELRVTENGAIIRTRCPKENVTEAMIHQRVLAANLSAGDVVRVQCMNHEQNTVLSFCEYLVFNRTEEFKRTETSDQSERQGIQTRFSVMVMTDWQDTPAAAKKDKPKKVA